MRGAVAMTNEQKEIIRKMRKQNESYAAISDTVGIPIGTIKSYCHRHKPTSKTSDTIFCKKCGTGIKNNPKAKPRLFCCDQCRQIWWNAHRTNRQSEKLQSFTCAICGKEFMDYIGANRKYCSQTCYRRRGGIDG
ncbi:MAG: RNA polymerase subunit sigma-70 [Ruminococcus sp.]|nr:RNA polymerase subunit sigma-70 [Ruminococcus sp.]